MNKSNIVLVGEDTLKLSLINKELSDIECVSAKLLYLVDFKNYLNNKNQEVDLIMLDYSSINSCKDCGIEIEQLNILLLVFNVQDNSMQDMLNWPGLRGAVKFDEPVSHLSKSVQYILKGGMWLPRVYLEKMVQFYRSPGVFHNRLYTDFTKRERQILSYLADGKSNQQIAQCLFLAESTVKTHIYKLYKKMNVHSRSDAVEQYRVAHWIH